MFKDKRYEYRRSPSDYEPNPEPIYMWTKWYVIVLNVRTSDYIISLVYEQKVITNTIFLHGIRHRQVESRKNDGDFLSQTFFSICQRPAEVLLETDS